jgi:multiple sugar transport system substrate-binding protein
LKPYITEIALNPTVPLNNAFSPAWGQCDAEQIWGQAHADVIKNGMTPAAAIDKAFKRCDQIFREDRDIVWIVW